MEIADFACLGPTNARSLTLTHNCHCENIVQKVLITTE